MQAELVEDWDIDKFGEFIASRYNYPSSDVYLKWYLDDYGYGEEEDAIATELNEWLKDEYGQVDFVLLEY